VSTFPKQFKNGFYLKESITKEQFPMILNRTDTLSASIAHWWISPWVCFEIVNALKVKWDVIDLGQPSRVFGMQLLWNCKTGHIFLHQQDYIDEFLQQLNSVDCKPAPTPHQSGY